MKCCLSAMYIMSFHGVGDAAPRRHSSVVLCLATEPWMSLLYDLIIQVSANYTVLKVVDTWISSLTLNLTNAEIRSKHWPNYLIFRGRLKYSKLLTANPAYQCLQAHTPSQWEWKMPAEISFWIQFSVFVLTGGFQMVCKAPWETKSLSLSQRGYDRSLL